MTQDYPLYVKWRYVTAYMLDLCAKFPKSVRFNLADRITNIALDVLEGIIDAIYEPKHTQERQQICRKLNTYIEKIRALLQITVEKKYISVKQYQHISQEINEAGKMLGGWIKQCKE